MAKTKYIFVMGGVISGLGKGIAVSSIALLLKSKGFRVTAIKIDPYINVDAGTMNPTEHGEVFVTKDGMETDQDIGNYERFLDKELTRDNYMTTGLVYLSVIQKERNLEYGGKCVEVVPHIPEEVIRRIRYAGTKAKADFVIIEIGGTVGEYQNMLFLEAARMMKLKNPKDVLFILVSYLPIPEKLGEMKTKPTQHATRALNTAGIQPDFILCRSVQPLDQPRKEKISVFCNIDPEDVISAPDVDNIYEIPLNFEKENLSEKICKKVRKKPKETDLLNDWRALVEKTKLLQTPVEIGIVGKYFGIGDFTLSDSYISVIEAIKHAAWYFDYKPKISWIDAEEFETEPASIQVLQKLDGIVVPGGFGERGSEGKIKAIQFARENKIPFLGLCYGMQLAVCEFARNVAGLKGATSSEINPRAKYKVIDLLPQQKEKIKKGEYGGTMRLGEWPCKIIKSSLAFKAYKTERVFERHRHRYEFNNRFKNKLEKAGLKISGICPENNLVEIIELPDHPWFVGVQFHPEFKSRPLRPHPLFRDFIKASIESSRLKLK